MPDGTIIAGTQVDDIATFCIPVDLHLRGLGQRSRLIIDVEPKVDKQLTITDK